MTYNMSHPVEAVLNTIYDLLELFELAGMNISTKQAVKVGDTLSLPKTQYFCKTFCAWNRIPDTDKTWSRMETQLHEAQQDLLSLPNAGSMYNIMTVNHNIPMPDDGLVATPTLTSTSFYTATAPSAVEMSNNDSIQEKNRQFQDDVLPPTSKFSPRFLQERQEQQ